MSLSNSLLSYEDVRKTLDRALEARAGVKVNFASFGQAVHFRQRAYKFRSLHQEAMRKAYPESDARYGQSVYDALMIRIEPPKGGTVFVRKREAIALDIEDIDEVEVG